VLKQVQHDVAHFEEGLALLGVVMNNLHYLANIRRKGPVVGMRTLVYELQKRVSSFKVQVSGEDELRIGVGCRASLAMTKEFKEVKDGKEFKEVKDFEEVKDGKEFKELQGKRFLLREEFAFLGEKDCPDEFKVLVADMITAHEKYIKGHELLYHVANKSNSDCFAAAELVVENYLNNRAIWAELEHYKKTGTILGLHPAFDKFRRREEIENMNAEDLLKLYRNLPRNISRDKIKVKENRDSEENKERLDRIAEREAEMKLVKRIMGIKEEKHKAKVKR